MKNASPRNPGVFFVDRSGGHRAEKRRASRARRSLLVELLKGKTLLSASGLVGEGISPSAASLGTFSPLVHTTPSAASGSNTMMLETDGSVLMEGGGAAKTWFRLVPDASGSYVNGTWSQVASMGTQRLYYGSNVLPDGRVLVQGGEYSGSSGAENDSNTGEIYNPLTNAWSAIAPFPQSKFGDDPTEVMTDGTVLAGYLLGSQTYLYNPSTNTWAATGSKIHNDRSDEESWTKLPDNSILSYDVFASLANDVPGSAQRYVPSTRTWVDAGTVPVALSSSADGYELGASFLLADGRVLVLGANGNTAYYTESTNSWTTGPVIPGGLGADDAPAAELPDGKILPIADTPLFKGPSHIEELDPSTNTFTDLTSSLGASYLSSASYEDRMLVLPTGQVLINNGGSQLEVFTPDPSSVPTISTVGQNADGSFTLTGTALNGISEGAAYGDDAEMSTNYPILNFTDSNGNVYYGRTFGWTSQVATGSAPVTTNFSLPAGLPVNSYQVRVIANGSASSPLLETNPTIVNAASASPRPDGGTTANLSVLGNDALGESSLTYTWATTSAPSGAAAPTFSTNGINLAKNDTVTFFQAGSYTFSVTYKNAVGLTTSSTVTLVVSQTVKSLTITPKTVTLAQGATQQFSASALDQFGTPFTPTFTYAVATGGAGGTVTSAGLYTAPANGSGLDNVTVSAGSMTDTATVTVQAASLDLPTIGDPGFESIPVGNSFVYNPTGSAWTFSGSPGNGSGVTGNNSPFTSANPNAPEGSQVAFLQANGNITQPIANWAGGNYTLSFQTTQRGNQGTSVEDFEVLVDGSVVGTFQPSGTAYQALTTSLFSVSAGSHTIEFLGLDSAGGDNTAFLDAVAVTYPPTN